MSRYACSLLQLIGGGILKFVDVFQFLNYLLEEMSSYNCFSLQEEVTANGH